MNTLAVVSTTVMGTALLVIIGMRLAPIFKTLLEAPATMKRLADEMAALRAEGEALTRYIGGFIRTCEANVEQYDRLVKAVEKLSSVVAAPKDGDVLTQYDEGEAGDIWRMQEYLAQGLSQESARARVAADKAATLFSRSVIE